MLMHKPYTGSTAPLAAEPAILSEQGTSYVDKYPYICRVQIIKNMNKFLYLALICVATCLTACSDDEPSVPSDALSLNMMNESNGATAISGTDIHITDADNFSSARYAIAYLGDKSGFSPTPSLAQTSGEAAVIPGGFYQFIPSRAIDEIAGASAVPVGTAFINLHVDSWLYDGDKDISGARVSFAETKATSTALPAWDSEITVRLRERNDGVELGEYSFPRGCVVDDDVEVSRLYESWLYERLDVTVSDNRLTFANPSYSPGGYALVTAMVRYGSVYTRARIVVTNDDVQ